MSDMTLDPAAIAAHHTAAGESAARLTEAAVQTALASYSADFAPLGLLGAEFAAAWRRAAGLQAVTLDTAARVVDAHKATLDTYGHAVVEIDDSTARGLSATEEGVA